MKNLLIFTTILFILTACSTPSVTTPLERKVSARLYNLKTGTVIQSIITDNGSGHGPIQATLPNGNKLTGEYSTYSDINKTFSNGAVNAVGNNGYAWATAQGFSFSQPGRQYGSATIAGGGLVIDIIYAVDPNSGHGHGRGKDNKGGIYKVQF